MCQAVTILSLPCPHGVAGLALTSLPVSALCWAAAAARQGIFPAQGTVESPGTLYHPGHGRREACLGKGAGCQGAVSSQRESVRKPFFSLWRLLGVFCCCCFVFPSFSPPQHICTEWEIKAAVNKVLAHRKVLEHPPSSWTASTWENHWERFKMELFCASVWV